MSGIAVIYKSKYGFTKKYAELIAQKLDARLFQAAQIKPEQLADFDLIIYGGGLYAGSINGVSLVTKNPCKSLIVFTVGLADPAETDFTEVIQRNFPQPLREKVKVFHLRGGVNRAELSLVHKGMLAVFTKALAKKDKTELTGEDKAMLEIGGQSADFTDEASIGPIIACAKNESI